MIAVWDPIALPAGFNWTRVAMLKRETGPYGVRMYAHWEDRSRLLTSRIELLTEALAENSLADYEELTLCLAAGLTSDQYRHEIAKFSSEVIRRALEGARPYERVSDRLRWRVHLVRPFESIGACGVSGLFGPGTNASLTCKRCIRAVLKHVERVPDPLEFVELRPGEIQHGRKVSSKSVDLKGSEKIDDLPPVLELVIKNQPITIDLGKASTHERLPHDTESLFPTDAIAGQPILPLD
jgi:hypothetical protein